MSSNLSRSFFTGAAVATITYMIKENEVNGNSNNLKALAKTLEQSAFSEDYKELIDLIKSKQNV